MSDIQTAQEHAQTTGTRTGERAADEINVHPEQVAEYAWSILEFGHGLDGIVELLGEPGVAGVLNESSQGAWMGRQAAEGLRDSRDRFARVAQRTISLAYLFAQVDAQRFGTGVARREWEAYLAGQAESDDVDGILGVLDDVNRGLEADMVGPASFRDARTIAGIILLPGDLAELSGQFSTVGMNFTIERAIGYDGGLARIPHRPSRSQKARARHALVRALGEKTIGPPNGHLASALVNEFVEHGPFESLDEIAVRLHARGSLPANKLTSFGQELLGASSRFARSAVIAQRVFTKPNAAVSRARAVVGHSLARRFDEAISSTGRGGVAAHRIVTSAQLARAATARGIQSTSPGRLAGKVVKEAGVSGVVGVVLLPFDVRDTFTADTRLGQASGGLGAASTIFTGLAIGTSWTGVGGIGFGTLALATGAAALATTGADVANQSIQSQRQLEAFEATYLTAAEEAYEEKLEENLREDIAAMERKYSVRRQRFAQVREQKPESVLLARTNTWFRLTPQRATPGREVQLDG